MFLSTTIIHLFEAVKFPIIRPRNKSNAIKQLIGCNHHLFPLLFLTYVRHNITKHQQHKHPQNPSTTAQTTPDG